MEDIFRQHVENVDYPTPHGLSWPLATSLLLSATLGWSMFSMPALGVQAGGGSIDGGMFLNVISFLCSGSTLVALGVLTVYEWRKREIFMESFDQVSAFYSRNSYAFYVTLTICAAVFGFLLCSTILVALANELDFLMQATSWIGLSVLLHGKILVMLVTLFVILPLCLLPSLRLLSIVSVFAVVAAIVIPALTISAHFNRELVKAATRELEKTAVQARPISVMEITPRFMTQYVVHFALNAIATQVRPFRYSGVVAAVCVSHGLALVFLTVTMIASYMTFDASVIQENVLRCFNLECRAVWLGYGTFFLTLITEYSVLCHAVSRILRNQVPEVHRKAYHHYLIPVLFVMGSLFLSVFTSSTTEWQFLFDIGSVVLAIIGPIVFLFRASCDYVPSKTIKRHIQVSLLAFSGILFVFGVGILLMLIVHLSFSVWSKIII